MSTTQELKATIGKTEDLHSVVKTMKALAAVSIRQYERAVAALADYYRTVEMGLQIVMKQQHFADEPLLLSSATVTKPRTEHLAAIIFGSDQGLCGQFNQQIAAHALEYLDERQERSENLAIAAVGGRVIPLLETGGYSIAEYFALPNSASGITTVVQEILVKIEQWRAHQQIDRIVMFYNEPRSGASYRSRHLQLLPIDPEWLRQLEQREWPTAMLPTFTMDVQQLFAAIVRQYIFVTLYRAFAASLASENASRLAAMQSAQKNIEERLSDLNGEYRRQRQSSITAELLDVVAGFEALTES